MKQCNFCQCKTEFKCSQCDNPACLDHRDEAHRLCKDCALLMRSHGWRRSSKPLEGADEMEMD